MVFFPPRMDGLGTLNQSKEHNDLYVDTFGHVKPPSCIQSEWTHSCYLRMAAFLWKDGLAVKEQSSK